MLSYPMAEDLYPTFWEEAGRFGSEFERGESTCWFDLRV